MWPQDGPRSYKLTEEVYVPTLEPDTDEYDNLEVKNDPVPLDEGPQTDDEEGGE